MDSEIVYSLVGIIILISIVVFVLKSSKVMQIQTKEEKRLSIISQYKKELQSELLALKDDNKARIAKKSELLKKFSNELALNIFFDNSEIREIILELSQEN